MELRRLERRVWVKAFAGRYPRTTKNEGGVLLKEFVMPTGHNRRYAA